MSRHAPPAEIRTYLKYEHDSGVFTWIARPRGRGHRSELIGREAGRFASNGYRIVTVCGRTYRVHHLVWWWTHGLMPPAGYDVDHRNGNRADNRLDNLRLATRAQNNMNGRPKGRSAYKGAHFDRGVWRSSICIDGKKVNLGRFNNEETAARAYDKAAKKHFGEFARLNFGGDSHAI